MATCEYESSFLWREGGECIPVFEICAAGLDSLEDGPFNLFSSKDERKTPNYACRPFSGDAL